MKCPICSASAHEFARAQVRSKYTATYYLCGTCEYVWVVDPYWLSDAYADPIAIQDVGLVARNLAFAELTAAIINLFFRDGSRFLDFGAGTGLFVRLMRDRGLNFFYHDFYPTNTFARGFEVDPSSQDSFGLITAFEVLEHIQDPAAFFTKIFALGDSFLFSTELISSPPPLPGQWWYYTLETGQHISFFTRKTLEALCSFNGARLLTYGNHFHLATKRAIPAIAFQYVCKPALARLINRITPRTPLTEKDYDDLVRRSNSVPS